MADNTPIEWTDATWNPITGCFVVSPGCTNCYAMKLAGTRMKNHRSRAGLTKDSKAGPVWTGEVRFNEQWLLQPLQWTKPRMIFVCAHGDLFAEGVPNEWIDKVFAVMALAPQHTFQVLTKRPQRMREYLFGDSARQRVAWAESSIIMNEHAPQWRTEEIDGPNRSRVIAAGMDWPLPNVWLGVSVEDQPRADERITILLDTPAAVRWISAEPLLGLLNVEQYLLVRIQKPQSVGKSTNLDFHIIRHALDWVVAGGESGPNARPMHPDWIRALRDQCATAGVPFLFKQWGEWAPGENVPSAIHGRRETASFGPWCNGEKWSFDTCNMGDPEDGWHDEPDLYRIGKKAAGRKLDGVLHDAFPQVRHA